MIRKDVIIAILATFCLTVTFFSVLPIRSGSTPVGYDPWADTNDDGKINMHDIGYTAQRYGATGDPTKNVNVVNWPIAQQQTVFYQRNSSSTSQFHNASGFSQIHLACYVSGLNNAAENVTLRIWAQIYNPETYVSMSFVVSTWTVTYYNNNFALSFSVPSETFRFDVLFASGTTADVFLAFYRTYV